jgi:hypothetical protein
MAFMPELTVPGVSSVDPRIELQRSGPIILRNSKIACWITRLGGIVGGVGAAGMAILALASLFPFKASGLFNAVWFTFAALAFGVACVRLWALGRDMQEYRVVLDHSGVNFSLGTKKKPVDMFLAWDQIAAIKRRRAGNSMQFFVETKDGKWIRFTSYTFFRPRKVAKTISQWSGVAIQKM